MQKKKFSLTTQTSQLLPTTLYKELSCTNKDTPWPNQPPVSKINFSSVVLKEVWSYFILMRTVTPAGLKLDEVANVSVKEKKNKTNTIM